MKTDEVTKPRVGVPYRTRKEELTGDFSKIESYVAAINRAGGEPVVISLGRSSAELHHIARTLDAILLSGSPADVEPTLFNATRHSQTAEPDSDRERTDFALLEHAFAENKPVLAICYGIQSLNVFLGGTLVQDIPSEMGTKIEHEWDDDLGVPETFHPVVIEQGSHLAQIAGADEARVNSSHHQSILNPGRDLRVVARAADQVVEAVEWTGGIPWVVGVQWHPERMADKDPLARDLFRTLIGAARKLPVKPGAPPGRKQ
jgi:putative glutamine amidotransferase